MSRSLLSFHSVVSVSDRSHGLIRVLDLHTFTPGSGSVLTSEYSFFIINNRRFLIPFLTTAFGFLSSPLPISEDNPTKFLLSQMLQPLRERKR